jgi:hypothetical protein
MRRRALMSNRLVCLIALKDAISIQFRPDFVSGEWRYISNQLNYIGTAAA